MVQVDGEFDNEIADQEFCKTHMILKELQEGVELEGLATHVGSITSIYMQFGGNVERACTLTEEMFEFYEGTAASMNPISKEELTPKAFVAAKYPKDDGWYRGLVKRKIRDDDVYKVFFVDYGNSEEISLGSIKPLIKKFAKHETLAVEVVFCAEIQPAVERPLVLEEMTKFLSPIEQEVTIFATVKKFKDFNFANLKKDGQDLGLFLKNKNMAKPFHAKDISQLYQNDKNIFYNIGLKKRRHHQINEIEADPNKKSSAPANDVPAPVDQVDSKPQVQEAQSLVDVPLKVQADPPPSAPVVDVPVKAAPVPPCAPVDVPVLSPVVEEVPVEVAPVVEVSVVIAPAAEDSPIVEVLVADKIEDKLNELKEKVFESFHGVFLQFQEEKKTLLKRNDELKKRIAELEEETLKLKADKPTVAKEEDKKSEYSNEEISKIMQFLGNLKKD